MVINLGMNWEDFYKENIMSYIKSLQENPFELITLILDLAIVIFLLYCFFKVVRGSRAWQLIKGIAFLIIATWVSGLLNLKILNWILTGIMNLGVIAIIVIFQPELRRGLEQLGTNKITKFFGIDKDVSTKTKEDIYKVVIAATELSKAKTGALIVFERDIKIKDIIATGIPMDAEVSPQLLVNIFEPKTPLHDGAVVIAGNKIAAAACVLPLADDKDIAKELGTRHRAAIGISKESDSIVVVVSEETGKMSVAKDGTLIADVREDVLKKILIGNIVTKRFTSERKERKDRLKKIKEDIQKEKKFRNIIVLVNDINRINLNDFAFGINEVLIIEDNKKNREKLKYLHSINWSKIINDNFKNRLFFSEYNFCDYTDYKNKYVSTFYYLDTEKINRIKYFLRENKNKNAHIICNSELETEIKKELPNADCIVVDLEDYIDKERNVYD